MTAFDDLLLANARLQQSTAVARSTKDFGAAASKWAQDVERRLAAPVPPAPSTSHGGVGLLVLGQPPPAGVGRFDLYGTDEGNIPAALAQTPQASRTVVYMAAPDVASVGSYGVDYGTAKMNGWLLNDAAGKPLVNVGYPSNFIGDIGSSSYRQSWLAHVLGVAQKYGCGVYIDDLLGDSQGLIGGGYPPKYPSRAAWQAAMAGFAQVVGDGLKAQGIYVMANANAFTPGSPGSNTAADDTAWWKMVGPHLNGLMREYWQQNPNAVDQVWLDEPALGFTGQWASWQTLPSVARSVGCDFYTASYGSAATLTYIRASFLLETNGHDGAVLGAGFGQQLPLTNLGAPLSAKSQAGSIWTRKFERGTVSLDALAGKATLG